MTYPPGLELTVEGKADTILVRLSGEFDLSSIGRVEATLDRALGAVTRRVVFDLRQVSFLDMAGLMTLIRTNERARQEAFDVEVVPPDGLASRVFTLTRAGAELTILEGLPRGLR